MRQPRDLQSVERLGSEVGLEPDAAEHIRALARKLRSRGLQAADTAWVFFVPGRIEVLGKHTDYGGGRSLVAATEQGLWVVAGRRPDRRLCLTDNILQQTVELDMTEQATRAPEGWSLYPGTVLRRLQSDLQGELGGVEVAFANDLPVAAGMSSSSALIVATYMALLATHELDLGAGLGNESVNREEVAAYLGSVEAGRGFGVSRGGVEGVGTEGGNQDHTAILCSREGWLRQYSYLPTRLEKSLPLPRGLLFAIASSGVEAVKTGEVKGHYNRAARLTRELTEIWNRHTGRQDGCLAAALASDSRAMSRLQSVLAENEGENPMQTALSDRLAHFSIESLELVPAAGAALERGDIDAFGKLADRSQELATRLLGNQIDETVWLAAAARDLGAGAASAFGAGYGGSVWALVGEDEADDFLSRWASGYVSKFPRNAGRSRFFLTRAGRPAGEI